MRSDRKQSALVSVAILFLTSFGSRAFGSPGMTGVFSSGYSTEGGLEVMAGQSFIGPTNAGATTVRVGWIHFVGTGCLVDFAEPFGTLNFFDVARFIQLFASQSSDADLAPPFGVLDFFDIAEFLRNYQIGCS